jgi:hypothetical protein
MKRNEVGSGFNTGGGHHTFHTRYLALLHLQVTHIQHLQVTKTCTVRARKKLMLFHCLTMALPILLC